MTVLAVQHLQHHVRRHFWTPLTPILTDVTFTVARGELFGFVGPNGAGKTTTIKSLLGLLRPQAGRIQVFGRSPDEPSVRARLGFMPEQAYFPEHLSAVEMVSQHALLAGLPYREARRAVERALSLVGLGDARHARLRTYSKGMLQRAGLAQALVGDPELVILDEPMSGLDPLGRHDVRKLMAELRTAGKTVFFSTHILPDVETLCDRLAIIVRGETRRVGNVRELVGDAVVDVELTVAGFDLNRLGETHRDILHSRQQADEWVLTCADVQRANRVSDKVRAVGGELRDLTVRRPSLEQLLVAEVAAKAEEQRL